MTIPCTQEVSDVHFHRQTLEMLGLVAEMAMWTLTLVSAYLVVDQEGMVPPFFIHEVIK
jgi:hypothetical protein